jgi:hypothetical protein
MRTFVCGLPVSGVEVWMQHDRYLFICHCCQVWVQAGWIGRCIRSHLVVSGCIKSPVALGCVRSCWVALSSIRWHHSGRIESHPVTCVGLCQVRSCQGWLRRVGSGQGWVVSHVKLHHIAWGAIGLGKWQRGKPHTFASLSLRVG